MSNITKKVAAVHDLSGCGRVSLTAVIPVLSSMGIEVCPLPTAVLSAHTQYPEFYFRDLTEEMGQFVRHWKRMGLEFDAIYSGYLGSPRQAAIVSELIAHFASGGQLVVVDPVLGDNGKLYASLDPAMVGEMRTLARLARVITPNITEMFLLLGQPWQPFVETARLKSHLKTLAELGPDVVIVTGVPEDESSRTTSVVAYDRKHERFWKASCSYLPAHYPGTGDTFTSVVTGSLLQGDSLPIALDRAVQFILTGIRATFGYEHDNRAGILLERVLPMLRTPTQIGSYELL
ncbi:MAG: pyridoxamine kinase [Opitutaceae bacterium]|jgi:pyridoxine kinase|nr:pyridoxamine kinase [Opitutaceae bacterium]